MKNKLIKILVVLVMISVLPKLVSNPYRIARPIRYDIVRIAR
jgi:hypothetical protein